MPNIASKEWTLDLLKKALSEFTPTEESDTEFGVGELISDIENISAIEFSKDGKLTIGENQYGYIKTSEEIENVLINNIPTTVLLVGTVEGINYYRNKRPCLGTVIFEDWRNS